MKAPTIREFDKYLIGSIDENCTTENNDHITYNKMLEYIEGHNHKSFVLCESEYFMDFFDEIKNNPECSYDTYLNDFIRENYDGKNLPISEISCFQKQGDDNLIEEVTCKLANALGIPTIFVKNVARLSQEEFKKRLFEMIERSKPGETLQLSNEDYLLAIDFIHENEHFDNLNVYAMYKDGINICVCGSRLAKWYDAFINQPLQNPITKEFLTFEQKDALFREFIPQYFFRAFAVRDWDLKSENVGIIYNRITGKYRLSPMFDFEYTYYNNKNNAFKEDKFIEDLIFAFDAYPEETANALINFETFDIDNFVENLYNENPLNLTYRTMENHKYLVKSFYNDFLEGIEKFNKMPPLDSMEI